MKMNVVELVHFVFEYMWYAWRSWERGANLWSAEAQELGTPHTMLDHRDLILEPTDIQSEHSTNEIYSDLSFILKFCTELSLCTLMFQLPIIAIIKVPQYYIS
jgi:hypothetical protein